MEKQTIRIRRVGSVTFGTVLIVTGLLFLAHIVFPAFHYFIVYRFWPVILILLGTEVLAGSRSKNYEVLNEKGKVVEQQKTIYDVPAILLMIGLTGFSMIMGILDFCYATQQFHMTIY